MNPLVLPILLFSLLVCCEKADVRSPEKLESKSLAFDPNDQKKTTEWLMHICGPMIKRLGERNEIRMRLAQEEATKEILTTRAQWNLVHWEFDCAEVKNGRVRFRYSYSPYGSNPTLALKFDTTDPNSPRNSDGRLISDSFGTVNASPNVMANIVKGDKLVISGQINLSASYYVHYDSTTTVIASIVFTPINLISHSRIGEPPR